MRAAGTANKRLRTGLDLIRSLSRSFQICVGTTKSVKLEYIHLTTSLPSLSPINVRFWRKVDIRWLGLCPIPAL